MRVGALLALVALLVAGCGGSIRREELKRGLESLSSYAAEGGLVADGVARDRTKATFVRVQARELGELADHEAEKLTDARPRADDAEQLRKAISLADEISSALGDLQTAPGDERAAREARRELKDLADEATRLAETL